MASESFQRLFMQAVRRETRVLRELSVIFHDDPTINYRLAIRRAHLLLTMEDSFIESLGRIATSNRMHTQPDIELLVVGFC